jgi:bifunctional DNA-binding transcriptional regulator/antitoxin component of YhaV-PrlF toxin-antitoxin module
MAGDAHDASVQRKRITAGGQVSIPAAVRARWRTRHVLIEDLGDAVRIRPAPADDSIERLHGIYPAGVPSDDLRRAARDEDADAEQRRA